MEYSFFNDYSEGAHPAILRRLGETNLIQETGYGLDSFSGEAAEIIKGKIGDPNVEVHFVAGGTLANLVVLSSLLKPYESVISASTGHINVHEAGAIEATGHRVDSIETADGKLRPGQIEEVVKAHIDEHMVKPRVVFISNSTEVGTVYSKTELEDISRVCRKYDLYLYLDGARLGSALSSSKNNLTLKEIANLVDVFYIGGTKNGALIGEAIIIKNPELQESFRWYLKQRGALLAKGRLLGIQFTELLKDDLWLELAKHANNMASKLAQGISGLGYLFQAEPVSNQIFPILPNTVVERLREIYGFYVWSKIDPENSSIRLVTSWATQEESVNAFLEYLKSISR